MIPKRTEKKRDNKREKVHFLDIGKKWSSRALTLARASSLPGGPCLAPCRPGRRRRGRGPGGGVVYAADAGLEPLRKIAARCRSSLRQKSDRRRGSRRPRDRAVRCDLYPFVTNLNPGRCEPGCVRWKYLRIMEQTRAAPGRHQEARLVEHAEAAAAGAPRRAHVLGKVAHRAVEVLDLARRGTL